MKWEVKTLDDLCDIARGGSPRPIKAYLTNESDGINWIKIADASASSKYIYETQEKIKPEGIKKSRFVEPGDFLLSNSMSFGRPYIMKTSGCIHDGWLVLKDKNGLFDQDYLYYFLNSQVAYKQFDKLASGSTVRNLNTTLVKKVLVPIPPLEEQKRIVEILDECFAGIEQAEAIARQNLINARELFDSYLNKIFTDSEQDFEIKTLNNVCIVERGSSPRPIKEYITASEDGVNWVKISDTQDQPKYITKTKQKITKEGSQKSRKVEPGDFILTNSMSYGKPYIMNTTGYIHDGWFVLRLSKNLDANFFYYLLSSNMVQNQFLNLASGSVVKNISSDLVKQAKFPIPPLDEQKKLVLQIENLHSQSQKLEAIYQRKLENLAELKQSILQKAFTGQLTQ
ncbi:restriction endonuclease subunit S [Synechocystis salina]|uniref:Restriction endonuclease subunit S n=1 Tax=Synechocystis salina LEGE 00031 TaxID=1828736 RepID=A0ABR9VW58_9SYNC|nr:restriction endonuclease subunit S [Synechocystis salina]MBE9242538.1 restriction endonuclease subunit S [Synechocystis salina LEGE 00041]MBE9255590.1 restriction endonuclease subunit S [Synechocystis salina LEGE 00031]